MSCFQCNFSHSYRTLYAWTLTLFSFPPFCDAQQSLTIISIPPRLVVRLTMVHGTSLFDRLSIAVLNINVSNQLIQTFCKLTLKSELVPLFFICDVHTVMFFELLECMTVRKFFHVYLYIHSIFFQPLRRNATLVFAELYRQHSAIEFLTP